MRVVAVVPAYQEEARIARTVANVLPFVSAAVVIDDASLDDTSGAAKAAGAHVLRHPINRGQGAALQTGTTYALERLGADIVVHVDGDGQMEASDIPALIAPLLSGQAEVALGSRFLGAALDMPLGRRLAYFFPARAFTFVLTGLWLSDVQCGFRALTKRAALALPISLDRMAHASELLDRLAASRLPFAEVPVTIRYSAETIQKSAHLGSFARRAVRVCVDLLKKRLV